jgi:hypothetical protein
LEPLEAETLEEREQDGIVCRVVRYRIGGLKGAPATMVGFDGSPRGARSCRGCYRSTALAPSTWASAAEATNMLYADFR